MTPEQVIADALKPYIYPRDNVEAPSRAVAALRAAGLLPGPGDIVVSREALQAVLGQQVMHCHQRPGIWDWDNGPRANQPCDECAARATLRAALSQPHPEETP